MLKFCNKNHFYSALCNVLSLFFSLELSAQSYTLPQLLSWKRFIKSRDAFLPSLERICSKYDPLKKRQESFSRVSQ